MTTGERCVNNRHKVLPNELSQTFDLVFHLTEVKVGNQIARAVKEWFKSTATVFTPS